ncbi:MAG: hypothetical protein L6U99_07325 [Clostridium sp.]|nr:MAG: hypothetical protein L6U99_07325 [Clostridium sp.]
MLQAIFIMHLVFLSTATSNDSLITLTRAYNFRNLNFVTSKDIKNTAAILKLSGVVAGKYITLNEIYNEGNISFNISNNISLQRIVITGVIEEVSKGSYAYNLYNGGNINIYISSSSTLSSLSGDMYVSGICFFIM